MHCMQKESGRIGSSCLKTNLSLSGTESSTKFNGRTNCPPGRKIFFAIYGKYVDELEVDDSPLVISPSWQAAYDKWDRERNRTKIEDLSNRKMDNVLLAGGKPFLYDESRNIAGIITLDGYEVPLHLDEDGKVIIPTPAEIDEMIANGEGEYVGHPANTPNQAPPPLETKNGKWRHSNEF